MATFDQQSPQKMTKAMLESYPLSKIIVGDREWQCRCDEVNGKVYLLDDNGVFTGKVANMNDVALASSANKAQRLDFDADTLAKSENEAAEDSLLPPIPTVSFTADSNDEHEDNGSIEEDPENCEPNKGKKKRHMTPLLLIIGAATIALIIFCVLRAMDIISAKQSTETTSSTQGTVSDEPVQTPATTLPSETTLPAESTELQQEEPTEDPNCILMLTAAHTLLPGHKIAATDFVSEAVTQEEYRIVCAAGGVYTEQELSRLVGLEISSFLAAGQYLRYDSVTDVFSPSNPWSKMEEGYQLITLPISATPDTFEAYTFGSRTDLTLVVQTKMTTPVDTNTSEENPDQTSAVPGMEHHTSIVESMVLDTYVVKDITVCDLLDQNNESLFSKYAALTSIPVAMRPTVLDEGYIDEDAIKTIIPQYVVVAIPMANADTIQNLNQDSMTVTISSYGPTVNSEYQQSIYSGMLSAIKAVSAHWDSMLKDEENQK